MDFVEEGTEDMQTGRCLTFSLGDVMFGIEMQYITEIIGVQKITELSDIPGQNSRAVKDIGKTESGIVLILDCEKLLNDHEIEMLSELKAVKVN